MEDDEFPELCFSFSQLGIFFLLFPAMHHPPFKKSFSDFFFFKIVAPSFVLLCLSLLYLIYLLYAYDRYTHEIIKLKCQLIIFRVFSFIFRVFSFLIVVDLWRNIWNIYRI